MIKIGILGYGFVGKAVANAFKLYTDVKVYDPKYSINTKEETIKEANFIFVCVPTPMAQNNDIDLSIIDEAMSDTNKYSQKDCITVIKSTVIPGSVDRYSKMYPKLKIVFNPEFLTERIHIVDFLLQPRRILGGKEKYTKKVKKLYQGVFPEITVYLTDTRTAELTKYMTNAFFAVKVLFFNIIYDITQKMNIDYREVRKLFLSGGWVAPTHTDVPGWDGKLGFGGKCYPKDLNALIKFGEKIGADVKLLKEMWKYNLKIRKKYNG